VKIADGDSIGQSPHVLIGRSAIAQWIEGLAERHLVHRIVEPRIDLGGGHGGADPSTGTSRGISSAEFTTGA